MAETTKGAGDFWRLAADTDVRIRLALQAKAAAVSDLIKHARGGSLRQVDEVSKNLLEANLELSRATRVKEGDPLFDSVAKVVRERET